MRLSATITLKDAFTSVLNKAYSSTKKFNESINSTSTSMKKLSSMVVSPVVKLKDLASKPIESLTAKAKLLARLTIRPTLQVIDRASGVIGRVRDQLLNLKNLAAGIILGAGVSKAWGATIGAAMTLEQQQLAMKHFIGTQNKGMSEGDIAAAAQNYTAWLRKYSQITPFSDQEILAGGARAINIAQGNIEAAKALVKLAGDMAALNPEKSYMDAMEALADLKTGETERMKEFGFRITADDILAASGTGKKKTTELTDAEFMTAYNNIVKNKLSPFFGGGAAELSQTGAGLWSTITGSIGTMFQNMGLQGLELLKPQMKHLLDFMSPENMQRITDAGSRAIASFLQILINAANWIWANWPRITQVFQSVFGWIQANMPAIRAALATVLDWLSPKISWIIAQIPVLQGMWAAAWPVMSSVLQTAWSIISPALDAIYNALRIVWSIFQMAWPSIVSIVQWAWGILKPIFDAIAGALRVVSSGVKWVADKVGAVVGQPKGYASGLAYVPYDNYPALLHEGERVLTAAENRQYNKRHSAMPASIVFNISAANLTEDQIVAMCERRLLEVVRNSGEVSPA